LAENGTNRQALQSLLDRAQWSAADLGRACGFSREYVRQLLTDGRRPSPRGQSDIALALGHRLRIDAAKVRFALFGSEDNESRPSLLEELLDTKEERADAT
jgi:transcriptional regulator with XRE-family HTH domain